MAAHPQAPEQAVHHAPAPVARGRADGPHGDTGGHADGGRAWLARGRGDVPDVHLQFGGPHGRLHALGDHDHPRGQPAAEGRGILLLEPLPVGQALGQAHGHAHGRGADAEGLDLRPSAAEGEQQGEQQQGTGKGSGSAPHGDLRPQVWMPPRSLSRLRSGRSARIGSLREAACSFSSPFRAQASATGSPPLTLVRPNSAARGSSCSFSWNPPPRRIRWPRCWPCSNRRASAAR